MHDDRDRNQQGWPPERRYSDGEVEAQLLQTLLHWLQTVAGEEGPMRRPPVVKLLTFADVVRYFTEHHPGDPEIQAGALLRRPHPGGSLMFQIFLNGADDVCVDGRRKPYGRVLVAADLDHELADKFRDVDLVIFR
jgi:hypothetical protein